jgi:hypothetical protein
MENKLIDINVSSPNLWVMVDVFKVCKHCCEGYKLWDNMFVSIEKVA